MKNLSFLLMTAVAPMWADNTLSNSIPVEIAHEKGRFSGQLSVSVNGPMNTAKAEWTATIRNTSSHKIFRATFYVKAFDSANEQLKPGGNKCI